jgi:hypothetical protein
VKLNSGKLVIVGIVGVAVVAAAFAWWRQYQQGRRALAYWGADGARLIRTAPEVELLTLAPAEGDGEGDAIPVPKLLDVSGARGLVHARQALISDASFLWSETPRTGPAWDYAFVFRDGPRELTVRFDIRGGWAMPEHGSQPLRMGPTLAKGLTTFLDEQFAKQ